MKAKEIFAQSNVLTLAKARQMVGKTILVTNAEYGGNTPKVRRIKVELITSWDDAKNDESAPEECYANRQEYWKSYMTPRQIAAEKNTYILKDELGNRTATCLADNPYFPEPTFVGSDEDREIYFVEEDGE